MVQIKAVTETLPQSPAGENPLLEKWTVESPSEKFSDRPPSPERARKGVVTVNDIIKRPVEYPYLDMLPENVAEILRELQKKKAYDTAVKQINSKMKAIKVKGGDKRDAIRERIRAKLEAKKVCYQ